MQKEAKKLEKMKNERVGARRSHLATRRVSLPFAKLSSEVAHELTQLVK